MARWICTACGTQFPDAEAPPPVCAICDDDREPPNRQAVPWTTLPDLVATDRRLRVVAHEPGLTGIGTDPAFAIGQRPILARTPAGNILWDCMAWLDGEVERVVRDRGGLAAIAISHPHFHTTMVEWADRFDVPIWLHEDDRPWVMRPSQRVRFWAGETHPLAPGATVVRLGGHFPGSTVLHWEHAEDGHGVLLTGDTIMPVPAAGWATFLYSYPNLLPLPGAEVRRIRDAVAPYAFDRLYAGWFGQELLGGADRAVRESADRYLAKLDGHVTVAPGVEGRSG
jgi:hypothetical protein